MFLFMFMFIKITSVQSLLSNTTSPYDTPYAFSCNCKRVNWSISLRGLSRINRSVTYPALPYPALPYPTLSYPTLQMQRTAASRNIEWSGVDNTSVWHDMIWYDMKENVADRLTNIALGDVAVWIDLIALTTINVTTSFSSGIFRSVMRMSMRMINRTSERIDASVCN